MKKHFLSFILLALTLGWSANAMAADYTFNQGTTIYIDFSDVNCNESNGVNYPNNNDTGLGYNASGCGTVISVTFSKNVTWSTNTCFLKCQAGGWSNCNFIVPSSGQNCAKVASDGKSYSWTTYAPPAPDPCPNCKTITK